LREKGQEEGCPWKRIHCPSRRKRQKCTFRSRVPREADGQSDPSCSTELVRFKIAPLRGMQLSSSLAWSALNRWKLCTLPVSLTQWRWRPRSQGWGLSLFFLGDQSASFPECVHAWRWSKDLYRGMDVIKVDDQSFCAHFALFAEGCHRLSKVIHHIGWNPQISHWHAQNSALIESGREYS